MSNAGRPDSAIALARSPLFAHLGRLDLARLAGELEEKHFAPGQAIVREGDRPDGFYVIKQGRAAVLVGGAPAPVSGAPNAGAHISGDGAGEPLTTLGAGEVFGEMALLTDSPRTATVVAETDLTVWRLSRSRFEALLDHERGIARSIERSLSHRLAAMSHETGALRAFGHRLAAAALGRLSPAAARLVAGVAARPRWNAEVLRRTCARTGDDGALAELSSNPACCTPMDRTSSSTPRSSPSPVRTSGSRIRPGCGPQPRKRRPPARSSRPRTSRSRRGRSRTPRNCSAPTRPACSRPRPPETSIAGSRRSASERRPSGPGWAPCERGSPSGWWLPHRRRRPAAASARRRSSGGSPAASRPCGR